MGEGIMKTCTVCGVELPTSLDEFGPAKAPLCREHFLNPPPINTPEIESLKEELADVKSDLDQAETEEDAGWIRNLKADRATIEEHIAEIESQYIFQATPEKVNAWAAGLPRKG
jgi:hypothetical protein